MAIPSYVFGGDTGLTPQDLKQRRELISAMAARNASRQPQDIWEGLSMLGQGLANRWGANRLAEAEKKGLAGAQSKFDALFSGSPADAADGATITPVSYSPDEQKGMPENPTGKWLMGQLKSDPDLKLTPAAAAGFTGNMDTETGGFKHMQEIKPTVPGSRGGFGFAQWTGDRRNQYEAWAKQQGMDPTSKEANYGFLKHELLNTPEGKVLASLQGVDDPATAAAIVSSQYLRPGTPNIQNRVSAAQRYAGMGPVTTGGATAQPAGGVRLAQAGGPDLNSLISAYSDPWMTGDQRDVLKLYIQQQLQAADPETKLKLKKMGLEIQALENPKPEYGFVETNDGKVIRTDKNRGTVEPVYQAGQKPTGDEQELVAINDQRAKAGLPPLRLDEWLLNKGKAGATNIDMGAEGPPDAELRKKLQGKEAEAWSGYQAGAVQAAGLTQQLDVLDELGRMAPQGGIQGRLAQMFPGFSTAGDAFLSIATRIAPSFRVPGSGSQSDIEYQGFLNSLPRLQTTPGGNAIISATIRAMSGIQIARGEIVDAYASGDISAPEARKRMKDLNKQSIMTPELQAIINSSAGQKGSQAPKTEQGKPAEDIGSPPEGVTPKEWQLMSPEDRALWK